VEEVEVQHVAELGTSRRAWFSFALGVERSLRGPPGVAQPGSVVLQLF
jgi:hypothetical protein